MEPRDREVIALDAVLSRLDGVRRTRRGWIARCPVTRRSVHRLIERRLFTPVRLPGVRRTLVDRRDLERS